MQHDDVHDVGSVFFPKKSSAVVPPSLPNQPQLHPLRSSEFTHGARNYLCDIARLTAFAIFLDRKAQRA
jgi:hypothetical protein